MIDTDYSLGWRVLAGLGELWLAGPGLRAPTPLYLISE